MITSRKFHNGPHFAIIGVAGYIARRHLEAIKAVNGMVTAALDISDSVGQMDAAFPQARFFTDFESFDTHVQRLSRQGSPINYVTICSPNHLHRPHIEFAMRSGAHAICEKPLVLDPLDCDELQTLERETGRTVSTILQLRLNPSNIELKKQLSGPAAKKHEVELTYVTARGQWYYASWKGDQRKSGGIATNIGVHFFDLLSHLFGAAETNIVHHRAMDCAAGYLEFERAKVRWFLSINARDIPNTSESQQACRQITIGSRTMDLSGDFRELHTKSYQEILVGRGFTISDVRPSIELVSQLRHLPARLDLGAPHPMVEKVLSDKERYRDGFPI